MEHHLELLGSNSKLIKASSLYRSTSCVDFFMGKEWCQPHQQKNLSALDVIFRTVNLYYCVNTFPGSPTAVNGPPLPRARFPLCLLWKSSFLDESRVSAPEPWRIHQSKCHLVSLMSLLIAQHVLLFQTSTVTCDYYKYFTHSFFTLSIWGCDWS